MDLVHIRCNWKTANDTYNKINDIVNARESILDYLNAGKINPEKRGISKFIIRPTLYQGKNTPREKVVFRSYSTRVLKQISIFKDFRKENNRRSSLLLNTELYRILSE